MAMFIIPNLLYLGSPETQDRNDLLRWVFEVVKHETRLLHFCHINSGVVEIFIIF